MSKRRNYEEESKKLALVIDIAIQAYLKHTPEEWSQRQIDHIIKVQKDWKYDILNPIRDFKSLASLKYFENDVFTYFQEGSGKEVEFFWTELNKLQLGYKRVNRLGKILKRGRIKNKIEYDNVIDTMLGAHHDGIISSDELAKLSEFIETFENKS